MARGKLCHVMRHAAAGTIYYWTKMVILESHMPQQPQGIGILRPLPIAGSDELPAGYALAPLVVDEHPSPDSPTERIYMAYYGLSILTSSSFSSSLSWSTKERKKSSLTMLVPQTSSLDR